MMFVEKISVTWLYVDHCLMRMGKFTDILQTSTPIELTQRYDKLKPCS